MQNNNNIHTYNPSREITGSQLTFHSGMSAGRQRWYAESDLSAGQPGGLAVQIETPGVSAFPGGHHCARVSALCDGVLPITIYRQPERGGKMAGCSPPKRSASSTLCSHAHGTRLSRLMTSIRATLSNCGPAAIPTGRPRSCWSARFAKMAESAVRFCARIAAACGKLGTRTGLLKSPKLGACPSRSQDSMSARLRIFRSARVVIISSESQSQERREKPLSYLNNWSSPTIRYRKAGPVLPGLRSDNGYHAVRCCRSP